MFILLIVISTIYKLNLGTIGKVIQSTAFCVTVSTLLWIVWGFGCRY